MKICYHEAYTGVFCEKSIQNDIYLFLQKQKIRYENCTAKEKFRTAFSDGS